jgi:ligand-binding sensor domain-containing protein
MFVRQIMAMGMMLPAILAAGRTVDASASLERSFRARLWQVDDGMPQNSVRDLAQTRDGYVWVGTLHN